MHTDRHRFQNPEFKKLSAFICVHLWLEKLRIVAILDKFDTLTHSISEGLPREIELRQKQYAITATCC